MISEHQWRATSTCQSALLFRSEDRVFESELQFFLQQLCDLGLYPSTEQQQQQQQQQQQRQHETKKKVKH